MSDNMSRIMRELENELTKYASMDVALYDRETGQTVPVPFEFVTGLFMMAVNVGVLSEMPNGRLDGVTGRSFLNELLDSYGSAKVTVGHTEAFQ